MTEKEGHYIPKSDYHLRGNNLTYEQKKCFYADWIYAIPYRIYVHSTDSGGDELFVSLMDRKSTRAIWFRD